ncbi:universal stress protein [Variovorax sp. LjRoot290]|jgi:nucleotide-binding universal stress UspA family protein|uniref:universal stress protein n=1 Tax=unclassified Variovorax TaxID=663243 RepID=UPI00088FB3B0|nr:universal stress protein [Variovorax sp. CF079]SDC81943.1 Nucleotide-binding universal stress protein, UspA family [Variovorax sp. CF079]
MTRILVPIDPNEPARTRSAIEQVVRMSRTERVTVRLLRVQPKVSGHVAMLFGTRELLDLQLDAGAEDLQYAQSLLNLAGVRYTSIVLVGRSAETIAMAARDYGCSRIVFGSDEPGLAGKIFGSMAQQVRQHLGASGDPQVISS